MGLVKGDDASIEGYVTGKALDGLYLMIGEEEKKIRSDPVGNRQRDPRQGLRPLTRDGYNPRDSSNISAAGNELAMTSRRSAPSARHSFPTSRRSSPARGFR